MKPRQFFDEIVVPNLEAMVERPGDVRLVVNTILTSDALVGLLYAGLHNAGHPNTTQDIGDTD